MIKINQKIILVKKLKEFFKYYSRQKQNMNTQIKNIFWVTSNDGHHNQK